MKRLDPASLAVGAAFTVLVGLLSAQNLVNSPTVEVRVVDPVAAAPHPSAVVRIVEGQPFVVPSGRLLVITAIGTKNDPTVSVHLKINGMNEASREKWINGGGSGGGVFSNVIELPRPGLVATGGDTVEVYGGGTNPDDARAWGYLADS